MNQPRLLINQAISELDMMLDGMGNTTSAIDIDAHDAYTGAEALTELCHGLAKHSGWWDEWKTIPKEYQLLWISTKLLLINSEVIEGFEGARKDLMDDHLPHRKMLEVELADAAIRIFDLAGGLGLDVAGAIVEKLAYNQRRADHKRENRSAEGGKKV